MNSNLQVKDKEFMLNWLNTFHATQQQIALQSNATQKGMILAAHNFVNKYNKSTLLNINNPHYISDLLTLINPSEFRFEIQTDSTEKESILSQAKDFFNKRGFKCADYFKFIWENYKFPNIYWNLIELCFVIWYFTYKSEELLYYFKYSRDENDSNAIPYNCIDHHINSIHALHGIYSKLQDKPQTQNTQESKDSLNTSKQGSPLIVKRGKQFTNRVNNIRSSISNAEIFKNRLHEHVTELTQQKDILEMQITSLQDVNIELNTKLNSKEAECIKLIAELSKLKECQESSTYIELQDAKIKELESHIEVLNKENMVYKDKIEHMQNNIRNQASKGNKNPINSDKSTHLDIFDIEGNKTLNVSMFTVNASPKFGDTTNQSFKIETELSHRKHMDIKKSPELNNVSFNKEEIQTNGILGSFGKDIESNRCRTEHNTEEKANPDNINSNEKENAHVNDDSNLMCNSISKFNKNNEDSVSMKEIPLMSNVITPNKDTAGKKICHIGHSINILNSKVCNSEANGDKSTTVDQNESISRAYDELESANNDKANSEESNKSYRIQMWKDKTHCRTNNFKLYTIETKILFSESVQSKIPASMKAVYSIHSNLKADLSLQISPSVLKKKLQVNRSTATHARAPMKRRTVLSNECMIAIASMALGIVMSFLIKPSCV